MTEPAIPQRGPYVLEVEPGKYAWCACGHSKKQPFCDGSHKGTGFAPVIVTIEQKQRLAFCGCKHTQDKPYCDGSHSTLG